MKRGMMSTNSMPGIGKSWKERREPRRVLIALASSAAAEAEEEGCRREASWATAAADDDDEGWLPVGRVSVIAEGKKRGRGEREWMMEGSV
jgi:hypothetical protein